MGLLDDAIREHLDLKRRVGADPSEIERMEREALGPVRREPSPVADSVTDHPAPLAPVGESPLVPELEPEAHQQGDANGAQSDAVSVIDLHDGFPSEAPEAAALDPEGEDAAAAADLPAELKLGAPPPRRRGLLHRRRAAEARRAQADAEREQFIAGLADPVGAEAELTSQPNPSAASPTSSDAPPHLEFEQLPARRPRFIEPTADDEASDEDLQHTVEHDIAAEFAAQDRSTTDGEETTGALDDEPAVAPGSSAPADEDVLEETPDFLQDAPDHDRLWFEQRPPRDFDFDN